MMHVVAQPEPATFDALVRVPGTTFLKGTPTPTSAEWNRHAYWREILAELRTAYGKICSYSCFWVPPATGLDTVEHYVPKAVQPNQAYEWSNYRFVCHRMNSKKGKKDDVLDPFQVENGWFTIEFPSLLVKPAAGLKDEVREAVEASIKRVGLNDPATCLEQRENYTRNYCLQLVTFALLQQDAPFLAAEIQRQGFVGKLNDVMGYEPVHASEFDHLGI